ncbi:MAG: hypothetical protein AAB368_08205 [bacterium]
MRALVVAVLVALASGRVLAADAAAVLPAPAPESATLQSPPAASATTVESDLDRRLREQEERIKQLEQQVARTDGTGQPGAAKKRWPAWWEFGCMGCCGSWALLLLLAAL